MRRPRLKFALPLIAIGIVLLFAGWALHSQTRWLGSVVVTLGGAAVVVGLSVLIFGSIRLSGFLVIELTGDAPRFRVGPPFLNVVAGDRWTTGAILIYRKVYLSVPVLTRLVTVGLVAWVCFAIARGAGAGLFTSWILSSVLLGAGTMATHFAFRKWAAPKPTDDSQPLDGGEPRASQADTSGTSASPPQQSPCDQPVQIDAEVDRVARPHQS